MGEDPEGEEGIDCSWLPRIKGQESWFWSWLYELVNPVEQLRTVLQSEF